MTLARRARSMLTAALEVYRDSPRATGWLHRHLARFDEPVRLAVAGAPESGRSTLVSALAGDEVAPLRLAGGDPVTWYRDGQHVRVLAHPSSGPPWELDAARVDGRLTVDQGGLDAAQVERVMVDWPSRSLRELTLIDTPPLTAPHTVETVCMDADAVLFTIAQPEPDALVPLRTMHDHPIALAAPVAALVVLTRADELGGGRPDALIAARQVARRFRREPRTRELAQDVLAVGGLAGLAARTLRDDDFAALAALAAVPRADLEPWLCSADRFAAGTELAGVAAAVRADLLQRFGMFGVRLAITLVRGGFDSIPALSAELTQRSGIADLRDAIALYLTARRPVLKARSALIALEVLLRMEPRPGTAGLVADLERTMAGAHEFTELRLLSALRTGRTALPEDLSSRALRLIGGVGDRSTTRLGLPDDSDPAHQRNTALHELRHWQIRAQDQALTADDRWAATVVQRSCEALLTG